MSIAANLFIFREIKQNKHALSSINEYTPINFLSLRTEANDSRYHKYASLNELKKKALSIKPLILSLFVSMSQLSSQPETPTSVLQ